MWRFPLQRGGRWYYIPERRFTSLHLKHHKPFNDFTFYQFLNKHNRNVQQKLVSNFIQTLRCWNTRLIVDRTGRGGGFYSVLSVAVTFYDSQICWNVRRVLSLKQQCNVYKWLEIESRLRGWYFTSTECSSSKFYEELSLGAVDPLKSRAKNTPGLASLFPGLAPPKSPA